MSDWTDNRGHVWRLNALGGIDHDFGDDHAGPICIRCHYSFCDFCQIGPKEDCNPDDAKPCSKCDKSMILHETGKMFLTFPGQMEREWWCACGHREKAHSRVLPAPDNPMERWRKVNGTEPLQDEIAEECARG